uniref:Uncharacterized protein n=1 Tax=Lactuca sativa TaxID=4236 RepID=A0A9R1XVL0_LACSA|nr:hypothetical protein LSAT_V11C100050110 [Lactuca sativa]
MVHFRFISSFGPSINTRTQVRCSRFAPNSSALPQGESPFFRSKSYQPNSSSFQVCFRMKKGVPIPSPFIIIILISSTKIDIGSNSEIGITVGNKINMRMRCGKLRSDFEVPIS